MHMRGLCFYGKTKVSERAPAPDAFATFFPGAAEGLVALLRAMFQFSPAVRVFSLRAVLSLLVRGRA